MATLLAALRGSHRATPAALLQQAALPGWWTAAAAAADGAAVPAAERAAATAAASTSGAATQAGWHQHQQSRAFAHHAHRNDPYTTAPTNYVQLLQHITSARRLVRLESLLRDHGPKFDALHVAAAIAVVPRLLGAAVERGGGLTPEQARRPRAVLEQLQELAAAHAERLQARQIANIVWALGKCHKVLGARETDSQARALAGQLLSELAGGGYRKLHQGGGAGDAAQLLHGMARLRLRRAGALEALAAFVADPRRPATVGQLALAAWGFGRLAWRDEALLESVAARVAAERLYLRPWSMAALLRTFTLQRFRHDGLAAAIAEVALQQLRDCRPLHLGVLAWGLARQRLAPEAAEQLRAGLARAAGAQLEGFGAVELGLLLEGLEGLGGADPALLGAVAEGIAKEAEVVLGPGDAARVLGAFAAAAARGELPAGAPLGAMVDRVAAAAARSTGAFAPPQVEAVSLSLARLMPLAGGGAGRGGEEAGGEGGGGGGGADAGAAASVQRLLTRLGVRAAQRPELYGPRRLAQLLRSFSAAGLVHERLAEAAAERLRGECDALAAGGGGGRDGADEEPAAPAGVQPHQVPNPGHALAGPIDLAAALAGVKRLRAPAAAALAAAAAPRLGDLRARKLAALLGALTSRGELLADGAVRALAVAAADDAERRLALPGGGGGGGGGAEGGGGGEGGVPPAFAAGLALAFARCVQHGLLSARGPALVDDLLARASEAGDGLPPRAAREALAALATAGVEGPAGLRAAAEGVLRAAGSGAAGGGAGGGDLMEAWES
ncbi:hypothetical protein Rsub_11477 [Raphidocelis subcapitata]|uniref:FAST kinase leucine-rich domain-containing protein n=1 Tax=Raphidocelis subcapitata TaxID=307507 RepID=A0A2V0PLF7_9CHLO|nr:hypothetical protein Rsub_11477 [Raphidocelis subcapitata]|eukprot:GBF98873.1 hypothetical protein Rsub_11477 [Raphidocelis subcapitata]